MVRHAHNYLTFPIILVAAAIAASSTALAEGTITHDAIYTRPIDEQAAPDNRAVDVDVMPRLDPRVLPMTAMRRNNALPTGPNAPKPGAVSGSSDGTRTDGRVVDKIGHDAYGTSNGFTSIAPYTIARASATDLGPTTMADAVAVTSYPWRVTGTLHFQVGSDHYGLCSASMIGPGLLVTAAHCVFLYGTNAKSGYHTNYAYTPAQFDPKTAPPYGTWSIKSETISSHYYKGTDTCLQTGVICNNDIAVAVVNPNSAGKLPGDVVGWYGYGWNGYSYLTSFGNASLSSITQLGYPGAFDSGLMMERNDGIGAYYTDGNLKNTVLGSPMTGGSSGGPWMVNFGAVPSITSSASLGESTDKNTIVGVTGWDSTTVGVNTMGASWFGENHEYTKSNYSDSHGVKRGAGNIGALIASICSKNFSVCP